MTRPIKQRKILFDPNVTYFKPRAVPLFDLKSVELRADELEALRFCDFKSLNQAKAAKLMKISRSTLQRILTSARRKIAEALVEGKAIEIRSKHRQ